MEENNNQNQTLNENVEEKKKHVCFESHCWKKCLAMLCAAFLGGFLAFYFVADQCMHKYHRDFFRSEPSEQRMIDDMERMYLKDLHSFEKKFDSPEMMPRFGADRFEAKFFAGNPVKIKTETEDNSFNIIVCLKPFQNDENKIKYEAQTGKITVYGNSETKHKNMNENVSFSQDFLLPANADINNITKTKDGKKLIISVPLKD